MRRRGNPYKLKSSEYSNKQIHADLIRVIKNYKKRLQKDADMKYGKGKYKVTDVYATKIIGGLLK